VSGEGGIDLWWIGAAGMDAAALGELRTRVAAAFGRPVRLRESAQRPADSFDPRRGQHSSTRILRWLAASRRPGTAKLLALTDVDLFIPVLTFVFGEAQLGGEVAVVSTARLADAVADPRTLAARLLKEVVHELGHTFGLLHCDVPGCVMGRSASLRHVDGKSSAFCGDCRTRLDEARHLGGIA
jgi:archaemetzincin